MMFRRIISAFVAITIMAPSVYLGLFPPPKADAYAVASATECLSVAFLAGLFPAAAAIGAAAGDTLTDKTTMLTQVPVTFGVTRNFENITNAMAGGSTAMLAGKECVLDNLAWILKKVLIQAITESIIAWINSGFDGSPSFLTNPLTFFQDIADDVAMTFLNKLGLSDSMLCSPFKVKVILGLKLDYGTSNKKKHSCSIKDIFTKGILSGASVSFEEGYDTAVNKGKISDYGLTGAWKVMDDTGNFIGQDQLAKSDMAQKAATVQYSEGTLLIYANGWFSQRCAVKGSSEKTKVCTPGEFISQQVNNWTNSALTTLEVADEVGEILNALFAQLVKQILTYAGGLLSFGTATITDDDGDTVSYWDLADEESTTTEVYWSNGDTNDPSQVRRALLLDIDDARMTYPDAEETLAAIRVKAGSVDVDSETALDELAAIQKELEAILITLVKDATASSTSSTAGTTETITADQQTELDRTTLLTDVSLLRHTFSGSSTVTTQLDTLKTRINAVTTGNAASEFLSIHDALATITNTPQPDTAYPNLTSSYRALLYTLSKALSIYQPSSTQYASLTTTKTGLQSGYPTSGSESTAQTLLQNADKDTNSTVIGSSYRVTTDNTTRLLFDISLALSFEPSNTTLSSLLAQAKNVPPTDVASIAVMHKSLITIVDTL